MSEIRVNQITSIDSGKTVDTKALAVDVPSIKQLTIVPNPQIVRGFYANTTFGGGTFIYDATASKANHNGGTIIAPEAIAAWNGTQANLSALLNWTGAGLGCFLRVGVSSLFPSWFGASAQGSLNDSTAIQKCFDAAANTTREVEFDYGYYKITSTLQFHKDVYVNGNGSWILNYGSSDAFTPASTAGIVLAKIKNFNITYQDYLSPLNPNSPPYTLDKTKKLGRQIKWTHLSTFTGDGLKHSSAGRFFQDFERINVQFHRYGFHMYGWTIQGRNCRALYNVRGFFGSNVALSGTLYPCHALQLNDCHAIANMEHGVDIRYADGINLKGMHAEKNYDRNIRLEGIRGFNIDQFYQEYSDGAILLFNTQGGVMNGYSSGNRQVYKGYAKNAASYYEYTVSGGVNTFTVPAYDSGTKLGVNGFDTISDSEIAVMLNDKYLLNATEWTKSADSITVPSAVNGDVISVIANAYRNPAVDTTAIQDKYELGTSYPIEFQHSQNIEFNGFVTSYRVGPANVNDFDLVTLKATDENYYNAFVKDTTVYNVAGLYYPWGTGFKLQQKFMRGMRINNDTDVNVDVSITGTQHYFATGATGSISLPTAKNSVFMMISANGCSIFTIDGNGTLASALTGNPIAIANTNPAQANKLNFYGGTANQLNYDNRLGYAAQVTLLRFADN